MIVGLRLSRSTGAGAPLTTGKAPDKAPDKTPNPGRLSGALSVVKPTDHCIPILYMYTPERKFFICLQDTYTICDGKDIRL